MSPGERMVYSLEEQVLTFELAQLEAWTSGDKSLLPAFVERRQIVERQPSYHFGEAFVLDHFHREAGWVGFADYMLMPEVEPHIARHEKGRTALEKVVPRTDLVALRQARRKSADGRKGYGEPDLVSRAPFRHVHVSRGEEGVGPGERESVDLSRPASPLPRLRDAHRLLARARQAGAEANSMDRGIGDGWLHGNSPERGVTGRGNRRSQTAFGSGSSPSELHRTLTPQAAPPVARLPTPTRPD